VKSLTYVEIDVPNFIDPEDPDETLRFAIDASYLPNSIAAIPSVQSINVSPTTIALGANMGQRATVTVTLKDHRHVFNGEDYDAGSFWGKFRGRYGLKLRGRPMRIIHGLLGESPEQMVARHYTIESTNGPNPQTSEFQIIGKDVLKLADNDRAQAPVMSNGFLLADLPEAAFSTTLAPTGIGDAEYPASGYAAIGGKEIIAFTRSGDVLTIARGQFGTVAVAHSDQDRVQLAKFYNGQTPAAIINDLLTNYAGIPGAYIPLAEWNAEMNAYMPNVYTATIAEPTGVNKLISEVIEQAGLAMWWDEATQLIGLRVLRPISTEAFMFTEENVLEGTLQITEQPDTRISEVWTYFGQRDPLKPVEDTDNYRSSERLRDAVAEAEYGGPTIKKIYGRWIPQFGRVIAERVNAIQLGRFRDPPRRFNFSVWRRGGATPVMLGEGYRLMSWALQDQTGALVNAPIQVTRVNWQEDKIDAEAEEMLFQQYLSEEELATRTITIDSSVNNFNLRTVHDTIYPAVTGSETPAIQIKCIINSGAIIGSSSTSVPAFDVGSWPGTVDITIQSSGLIQGAGGGGGRGFSTAAGEAGSAGGPAFYTRYAIDLNNAGSIWGGGGGGGGGGHRSGFIGPPGSGGGAGGGGGSGTNGGDGGSGTTGGTTNGSPGTAENGGAGGISPPANTGHGGAGGNPGSAGSNGAAGVSTAGGAGGAGGAAVDGTSFVTYVSAGSILGSQIN
jgi:hypothetical protein